MATKTRMVRALRTVTAHGLKPGQTKALPIGAAETLIQRKWAEPAPEKTGKAEKAESGKT